MSTSPLMAIETLHKEMVHDAQLDYYSRKLATASSDRTVEVRLIAVLYSSVRHFTTAIDAQD
jgi:hypothetical protein